MQKYISYILILIILVGLFGPTSQTNAADPIMGTCTYTYESYGKTVVEKTRTIKDNCKGIDRVWEPDIASPTDKTLGTCTYTYESYGKQKFELTHTFKTNCTGADRSWKESTLAEFQAEKAAKEGSTPPEELKCLSPQVPKDGKCVDPDNKYYFLSPLPCENGTPGCVGGKLESFDPTGENKIGGYLNLMINLFIGICAVLAVIMIVVGGIEYMTSELISSKEHGKERITGAIFGLILALGAWTLLYQINPDLLNTDLTSLKEVVVVVDIEDNVPQTPVSGKYSNGFTEGEDWVKRAGGFANLTTSGAKIYNSECTKVGQRNCTSTRGLNPSTLNTIHQQCPSCTLLVTGGTEFWLHGGKKGSTSHQIGNSTVDLAPNPALNAYLSGGKPLVKFKRYPQDGGPNYYEGNHWHIGP